MKRKNLIMNLLLGYLIFVVLFTGFYFILRIVESDNGLVDVVAEPNLQQNSVVAPNNAVLARENTPRADAPSISVEKKETPVKEKTSKSKSSSRKPAKKAPSETYYQPPEQTSPSIKAQLPAPDFQKGYTYTSWWNNDYFQSFSDTSLDYLNATGTEYVSLLVTWYQDTTSSTTIYRDTSKTPSDGALVHAINDIHNRGMKVMLKPHVDVKDYSWRGDIVPSDWNAWFTSYADFINYYADLAQANGVEQFVVGTELKSTTSRTADWQNIIAGVRSRFSGPITYSANHDNYQNIGFWNNLDFIGVNAYFALTGKTNPTLEELETAWVPIREALASYSSAQGKDIVFTEIGYQSIDGTNMHPWWSSGSVDLQEQADCYRAMLNTFWNETWFKGMYFWHWYVKSSEDPDSFAAYNKPAEDVVKEFYIDTTCYEDWAVQYGLCQTNDLQLKYYVDQNSCGTINDLPADNGTYISCNYCTENIQGPFTTSCQANDEQIEYYVDTNYQTCCAVTGLSSDCSIDSGAYDNQTLTCDYCTPDWQAYNTTCNGTHLTQYYEDDNNCYAQTGLSSDLAGQPSNQTFTCSLSCLVPYSGMTITQDTVFCKGDYTLNSSINITSDNVELDCNESTFHRLNTTYTGIYANAVSDVAVRNCNFNDFMNGVHFYNVSSFIIEDINTTGQILMPKSTDGLVDSNYAWKINAGGTNLTISNNYLTGNDHLIYLNRVYYSNIVNNNLDGFANWARGISLDGVFYNTFENNTINDGGAAFYCWWNCKGNTIKGNRIENNAVGIVESKFTDTVTYLNEFIGNSNDISHASNYSNNVYDYNGQGNRWSVYDEASEGCYDADFDDVCDLPYVINNTNQDNYPVALPCTPEWQQQIGSCQTDDQQLIYYTDNNSCGTSLGLPADNGTYQGCDYCTPDWQPYQTECIANYLTQYYLDDNNCYAQTNLSSDLLGRPGNETIFCGVLPDLTVKEVTVITQNATVNEWINLQIIVENIGTDAASNVHWELDTDSAQPNPTFGPFSVDIGETVDLYPAVKYLWPGNYSLVFTLDYGSLVDELNETNNDIVIPLEVGD